MVNVRPATLDDLEGIFAIYDQHVLQGTATFETVPKTAAERVQWLEAHAPERHPAIVALDDGAGAKGTVAGWAGISAWSPRQAYARIAENSVYVDDRFQGRGLGRRLMEELIQRTVRDTAVRVLIARIALPNDTSIRLHERLGFKAIGTMRRCGQKHGRILDVLLMDLHLDGG